MLVKVKNYCDLMTVCGKVFNHGTQWHCFFVFGSFLIQIPARRPVFMTKVSVVKSLVETTGIVSDFDHHVFHPHCCS
jgi:hypothetical protein